MAKLTKRCRVCGKEFEACRSLRVGSTVFNWREVACSPECGVEYLRLIDASRGKVADPDPKPERVAARSSRRGKSESNATVDAPEVVMPAFVQANADYEPVETEHTEE